MPGRAWSRRVSQIIRFAEDILLSSGCRKSKIRWHNFGQTVAIACTSLPWRTTDEYRRCNYNVSQNHIQESQPKIDYDANTKWSLWDRSPLNEIRLPSILLLIQTYRYVTGPGTLVTGNGTFRVEDSRVSESVRGPSCIPAVHFSIWIALWDPKRIEIHRCCQR